jgi:hypothetical protein
LGYWAVLLLKMPLEVLEVMLLRALFAHTEFVVPVQATTPVERSNVRCAYDKQ